MDLLPASALRPVVRTAGSAGAADRQAAESHAMVPSPNAVPQFSGWSVAGVKAANAARANRIVPFRTQAKAADPAEPVSASICDLHGPGPVGGILDHLT